MMQGHIYKISITQLAMILLYIILVTGNLYLACICNRFRRFNTYTTVVSPDFSKRGGGGGYVTCERSERDGWRSGNGCPLQRCGVFM